MSRPADEGWKRATGLIVALAFLLQVGLAGWGPLFNETDGQYGGAARVMAEGGDWLIPENNGTPRLVKPPLLYWLMAGSMSLFGVNEFAARLPGALATASLALLAALIAREAAGWQRAALAAAIVTTMLGSFTLCRIVMPEPLFSAFIAASLWALLCAAKPDPKKRLAVVLFWAFAGLAAFVKGPHGVLYPLVIAALAVPILPGIRFRDLFFWPGPAIALAINLPWYFLIESRFPGYLANLVFSEHLGHVVGSDSPATSYTNVPRWLFLLLHLAWFFPWSVMVICSVPSKWHSMANPSKWSPSVRLCAIWLAVIGLSVLLSGQRQDYYAMSLWVSAAVLGAAVLDGARWKAGLATAALILVAALGTCLFAPHLPGAGATVETAKRATASLTVSGFGRDIWNQLTGIALWSLLPSILALLSGIIFPRLVLAALILAGSIIAVGATAGTAAVSSLFSLEPVAGQLICEADEVIFEGDIDTASSLLVYTKLPVRLVGPDPNSDFVTRTTGRGRTNYLDRQEAIQRLAESPRVILIAESSRLDFWESLSPVPLRIVAHCGTLVLLAGCPATD
ncbi:MAG: hypothetical protein Fur0032_05200 [Terrimicrobiaceae bacterium]